MSHQYKCEPEGLYRHFTGETSGDETLESNFEIHKHPIFLDIQYVINDFTYIPGHSIGMHHPKTYSLTDEVISRSKGNLKIALIVTKESLIPLAISYRDQMIDNVFECDIFNTIDNARIWATTK